MAERVGCAPSLRSLRLPPVAELSPVKNTGEVLIPTHHNFTLPSVMSMAERVGFEPTSPFGRTAFRERRLKPLGNLSVFNDSSE
jgi:hypothetical protein